MNNMKLPVGIDQFDKLTDKIRFLLRRQNQIDRAAFTKLGRSKSIYTSSAFWKDFEYEYAEILF